MDSLLARVLLLLYVFPSSLLAAPAAQEDLRRNQGTVADHSIQFPGQDAFLAIIGLKNHTTERPIAPTNYRPTATLDSAPPAVPTELATVAPVSENESTDCRENYIWQNVSPYDQRKYPSTWVDTRLSVEAIFTIANHMEAQISDKNLNLVFSPLGLTSVLGQLMLAARGDSLSELEHLLAPGKSSCRDGAANKFHSSFRSLVSQLWRRRGSESYELSARNALFYQSPGQTLNRNFTRRLSAEYATEIFSTDFRSNPDSSLRQINNWASGASRGKISQLVQEVPSRTTTAVISSVTYFKASWENVFNKQYTGPGPFYLDGDRNGRVKTVDFMLADFEVPYVESAALGCRMLVLPYTNNETALYLVMPLSPHRRKRPPTIAPSQPSIPSLPQNSDIPLFPRIQEVEPQDAQVQTALGNRIPPSPVTKPPQMYFYLNDAVVYPGSPHQIMATILRKVQEPTRRQSRQVQPCSETTSSTTVPSLWWTTTTTSAPCLEERFSGPRADSPLSPTNLHQIASRLGPSEFSRLASEATIRKVSVILPKLSMESNVNFKDALFSLGVSKLFGSEADLSGAVYAEGEDGGLRGGWGRRDSTWWKVDDVWQNSRMEVNEYGTEAASGTAIGIVDYGGDSVIFKANSPFLAVVRHEATGAPIFWASIVDPS